MFRFFIIIWLFLSHRHLVQIVEAAVLVVDEDDAIICVKLVVVDSPPPSFPPNLPPPPQVDLDRRKEGDMGNNCLMTINGTDFWIPAIRGNAFVSHKYVGKVALRYEIEVSILGGDLVWIQGPYPASAFNNVNL